MAASRLDPIDRKILAELQADGRMTNVELAKRVGISAPPCLRRVRTLEEQGYIRGYHADVDARELGFDVSVFAMVRLVSQSEAELSAFEARCNGWSTHPRARRRWLLPRLSGLMPSTTSST